MHSNTRTRSHSRRILSIERIFMINVRSISIQTQIPYNIRKLNKEDSWKEVIGKKRNRNNPE